MLTDSCLPCSRVREGGRDEEEEEEEGGRLSLKLCGRKEGEESKVMKVHHNYLLYKLFGGNQPSIQYPHSCGF